MKQPAALPSLDVFEEKADTAEGTDAFYAAIREVGPVTPSKTDVPPATEESLRKAKVEALRKLFGRKHR